LFGKASVCAGRPGAHAALVLDQDKNHEIHVTRRLAP